MKLLTSTPRTASGAMRVQVAGGYEPDVIVTRAGQPLTLTFHRQESWPCSDRVVFPDFGLTIPLPVHRDVLVELVPDEPGEYEFTRGNGRLEGRLIVEPAATQQSGGEVNGSSGQLR